MGTRSRVLHASIFHFQRRPERLSVAPPGARGVLNRILMTADAIGGVWTYALELTRSLQPHGIEVVLATMGRPLSPDQQLAAKTVRNLEIVESDFRLEWMENPW